MTYLQHLFCPTCGEPFRRDAVYERPEPPDVVTGSPPYLVCRAGHGWTIKTLTQSLNRPDDVLLGEYIGER